MTVPSIVTIASPTWNLAASFGRYALELKQALENKGIQVNTVGKDAPKRRFMPTLVNLRIGYPTGYDAYGALVNSGLTISLSVWESTRLHEDWVPILNRASAVVVPCRWNMDVYKANGVIAPLYYMPHGISDSFHYVERPERKPFRFILIADREERKGFIDGMNAFWLAFGKNTDVELVLKARLLPKGSLLLNLSNPNMRVINEEYSDEQMQALYASADCMIFATHGEGFGFPPREFAATGGLALATNYSGTADDLDQWGIGINYSPVAAWAHDPLHVGLGEWAQPDVAHLAQLLLGVKARPYADRIAQGRTCSHNVRSLYRWQDNADTLLDIIQEAEDRQKVRYAI